MEEISFPVFLKYNNNLAYFRINSVDDFEELNLIGEKVQYFHFKVKIYPDRMLIKDMLLNKGNHWTYSSEKEYEDIRIKFQG